MKKSPIFLLLVLFTGACSNQEKENISPASLYQHYRLELTAPQNQLTLHAAIKEDNRYGIAIASGTIMANNHLLIPDLTSNFPLQYSFSLLPDTITIDYTPYGNLHFTNKAPTDLFHKVSPYITAPTLSLSTPFKIRWHGGAPLVNEHMEFSFYQAGNLITTFFVTPHDTSLTIPPEMLNSLETGHCTMVQRCEQYFTLEHTTLAGGELVMVYCAAPVSLQLTP